MTKRKASVPQSPNPMELYLDDLVPSGRRSMRSLLGQAVNLLEHGGSLESFTWQKLGYAETVKVRSGLMAAGKSANTVNATLSAIQGVARNAFLLGQIPADTLQRIRAVKRARGKPLPAGRSLSRAEFAALLKACVKDKTAAGIRDAAVLVLLAGAGLRRSKAIALERSDYQSRTGKLRIRNCKGNKQRELVLPIKARELVKPWLTLRGKADGPLLCPLSKGDEPINQILSPQAIYDIIRKSGKEAKIAPCSPHDLRRTFITRLLDDGVDLNTTRQLAGHEDIQTTARYDRREGAIGRKKLAQMNI